MTKLVSHFAEFQQEIPLIRIIIAIFQYNDSQLIRKEYLTATEKLQPNLYS